jgi:hypothetical protein
MNFRELINKLDHINEAEGLTLQSIAAIEKAAMEKAGTEKAKGGWTGFTTWDPRVAGNIALAKLAQQNNFEGLFNSEGDFVVAYGNRTWSSNSELHPGENPRVVPPSPDDWKPLAAKGLVPQNAKGPAGLINWLSSGGAQKEFDAVKKQSADVASNTAEPINAAQAPKISSATDEGAKMTQLEGLVDQYLKLKADIKTGVTPVKGPEGKTDTEKKAELNALSNGTGIKLPPGAENPIGAALSKRVADLDPTRSKIDYRLDPEGKAKLNAMNESSIAQSLVESFGYQKKTDLHELIESFGYRKNYPYSTKFLNKVLTEAQAAQGQANLNSLPDDDIEDMSPEEGEELIRQKFGPKEKKPWTKRNVVPKLLNPADWKSITWEDEIIPGIYDMKDLAIDLGIAGTFVLVGTIAAPFFGTAAGAAAGTGYLAASIFIRVLVRIALAVARAVKLLGKPFWEFAQWNLVKSGRAVGDIVKRFRDQFWTSLTGNLGRVPFAVTAAITMVFNSVGIVLEKHFPDLYKKLKAGSAWVGDNVISPGVDAIDKVTGLKSKAAAAVGAVGDAGTWVGNKLGFKEGLV